MQRIWSKARSTLAGVWQKFIGWGTGIPFIGPYVQRFQKYLLWATIGVGTILLGQYIIRHFIMFWWFGLKLAFAGLGSLMFHWGLGIAAIIVIIIIEIFAQQLAVVPIVGRFIVPLRKDLIWVAIGIAVFLAGQYVGAKDMAGRCKAKEAVITHQVKSAVKDAKEHPGLDRWDVNK